MNKEPLEYGIDTCEALMRKFRPEELPPAGTLFYHQGVALSGMQQIYFLTGEKRFFNYIKDYVDSVIGPNGELYGFNHELTTKDTPWLTWNALTMLDHKQPVILFYDLYDETGDEKYVKVIKTIAESMYFWPVNSKGGYWHMMTQPYQMWMDGAYMAGPLSVMYADRFGDTVLRERAIKQILIMNENMRDAKTGLYYHGWDESKAEQWADKQTGLSGYFWGRAVGWYAVAILDILDYIPEDHTAVGRLKEIEKDLLKSLAKYQDKETGMWFNVLDKTDDPKNWVESSCTNLFIYSYAKAIRKGIIGKEYEQVLMSGYEGIRNILYYDENGDIVVDKVCVGTCIESGTYEHYICREQIKNDLHGTGAFLLMCAEMQRYLDSVAQ
ncbi:MAG: glycoside hydrolase family 88 protein [Clostridia bacterium]|nr:glycoside hydrolase family 88 protein [Clostridia bacterium]